MKKIIAYAIVCAFLFPQWAMGEAQSTESTVPQNAEIYFKKAVEHQKAGEMVKAIEYFKKTLEIVPDAPAAYGLLSFALLLQTRYEEAKEAGIKAHELDPSNLAWAVYTGHAYLFLRDAVNSRGYYRKALALIENDKQFQEIVKGFQGFIEAGWNAESIKIAMGWIKEDYGALKESKKADKKINDLVSKMVELFNSGQFEQALPYAKSALEATEKAFGKEHPDVAARLSDLAVLYVATGKYAEAEPLFSKSLEIREKTLGNEHPDTVICLYNMANMYYSAGSYAEAVPSIVRALALKEKVLSKEHPEDAKNLDELAGLLAQKLVEAASGKPGEKHQNAVQGLEQLAQFYKASGKYEQAAFLYSNLLEIKEKTLGPNHPDVAPVLESLAEIYTAVGRHDQAKVLALGALRIKEKAAGKEAPDSAIKMHESSLAMMETTLGKEHSDVAKILNVLGGLYHKRGRYAESEQSYKRALEIREKALGKEHNDVASSLNNLAELYHTMGRYAEAEPLYLRSLAISEKVLGKEHNDVATSLNNLAAFYMNTGRYAEAEPLFRRSLEITEKVSGKEHNDVATSLNNLALLYVKTGRYAEAEPLYKRSLEIKEKVSGKNHSSVAISLSNLAGLYHDTGRYAEAEPLYKRSVAITEKAFGKEHPDVATGLNNLAGFYKTAGRYAEAELLFKRSIEINEKALGKEHPGVATCLNNLGVLYDTMGRYTEAELLYQRSLAISEKALGKEHPDVAQSLNNLALFYVTTGRYSEAEPLYKRALDIVEKALGKEHPDVAKCLSNLGLLYHDTGRDSEAEPLYKGALEIYEKALGRDHPHVATYLNNLAAIYYSTNRYSEAEPLYKRSLGIVEKHLGRDHPEVTHSLNNLATLYSTAGRYPEAETLLKRALGINEKTFGKDHPNVARGLNNLSALYFVQGKQVEAEILGVRALSIREKALGPEHPAVGRSLDNLAMYYAATGKHSKSHHLFYRAFSIKDKEKEDVFLLLSEKQKLKYVKDNEDGIHSFLSHSATHMQSDPSALTESLNAWLRWKGVVMEAQGRYLDAVMSSDNPNIKKKFTELIAVKKEIARLQLSKPEKMPFEECKKSIEDLDKTKGTIEAELSRLSRDFSLEKIAGRADAQRLSRILDESSLYLDFARIETYDFKKNEWAKARYLLFVMIPPEQPALKIADPYSFFLDTSFAATPKEEPVVKLIDLADAEEVDKHVRAYMKEMNRVKTDGVLPRADILSKEAKALYEIVLKPAEQYLKGKKRLFISPDGNLNLIPFEVLITPKGKYLTESYPITYIAAGRDIMRFIDSSETKGESLIMADPDYDMGAKEREKTVKDMGIIEAKTRGLLPKDIIELNFGRLADTKPEADAIEKTIINGFRLEVKNYQGKMALEDVLFKAVNPRILHLATHGYFLKAEEVKHDKLRGVSIKFKGDSVQDMPANLGIENPMLRSGIVLAGVNTSIKEGRDDGMVSAEKILGLKLKGTDLVVLSACETGVGDVQNGEGVFGLKRAFILSGAKTVVMSLWSVPSAETTELMTEFYTLMSKGKSKAEALRRAKVSMMQKNANPFYWGAFIMVGRDE